MFWKLIRLYPEPCAFLAKLELSRALKNCDSALDVGCGKNSALKIFGLKHLVGLEGYAPDAEAARQIGTHDEIITGDLRQMDQHFKPGQFDVCVALDVIEHLPKQDGLKMLSDMERASAKRTIILTPNGFLPQFHTEDADLQQHLSGWEVAEMRAQGYKVIGLLGLKSLRGEYHMLKRKPKFFWSVVSLLTQLFWTRNHPKDAAAILCIKETDTA